MKRVIVCLTALVLVVFYVQSVFGQMGGPRGVQWIDNGQNRSASSVAQRPTATRTTAGWTNLGNVNGIQVYRDERTGLEWTVTIGQVQSSGWGAPARTLVQRYGFRLPSFQELSVMSTNGGLGPLNIRRTLGQYYETSDSNILGNAAGVVPGFRTPQQRQGRGMNWVIGVRQGGSSGGQQGVQQGGSGGGQQGGGGAVVTGNQNQNSKIRVLFIFGTKDMGSLYQESMKVSRRSLQGLIASSQLSTSEVSVLEGNAATKDNVLSTVRRLCQEAGSSGAVLVYYLGHGGTVSQAGRQIHCIFPMADEEGEAGTPIARTDIYNLLVSGGNRFVGLITDACSNVMDSPIDLDRVGGARANAISPLRALLLYGRGTIDIGSSDANRAGRDGLGQVAFFTDKDGAFFTQGFCDVFAPRNVTRSAFTRSDFNDYITEVQSKINGFVKQSIAARPHGKIALQGRQDIYIFHNTLR